MFWVFDEIKHFFSDLALLFSFVSINRILPAVGEDTFENTFGDADILFSGNVREQTITT